MSKRAFTLTEALVMMAVLGVLATIAMPVISNARPNQEAIYLKKSIQNMSEIVSTLANDEMLYPYIPENGASVFKKITKQELDAHGALVDKQISSASNGFSFGYNFARKTTTNTTLDSCKTGETCTFDTVDKTHWVITDNFTNERTNGNTYTSSAKIEITPKGSNNVYTFYISTQGDVYLDETYPNSETFKFAKRCMEEVNTK